jgi:hypothetical protein
MNWCFHNLPSSIFFFSSSDELSKLEGQENGLVDSCIVDFNLTLRLKE